MSVETALYPPQLNTEWPRPADMVSEGDDHLRLLKTVEKTTWPNVFGVINASDSILNTLGSQFQHRLSLLPVSAMSGSTLRQRQTFGRLH